MWLVCVCASNHNRERERGEIWGERERERDCVSSHLWALVLGNTSCFDMSHNLWESVRGLARHTHTHRHTHSQSKGPTGCERRRENACEGKKKLGFCPENCTGDCSHQQVMRGTRLQQQHTDCYTTVIMLLFREATAPTTDICWDFRKTCVCVDILFM